jgi:hypothetical protein
VLLFESQRGAQANPFLVAQEEKRGRLEEALHSLDSAIEGVRSQASLAHLSEVLNVWEERLDVHAGPALKGVVRAIRYILIR